MKKASDIAAQVEAVTIKTRRNFLKKYFPLISIILVIVLAFSTAYFYKRSISSTNPAVVSESEAKQLIAKVNKLVLLPTDETPTIATVSDPEKLKDQSFFAEAKVGYKVLVYTNAKKAILYDPESGKIVTMAPVNTGSSK